MSRALPKVLRRSLQTCCFLLALTSVATAQIFQWEPGEDAQPFVLDITCSNDEPAFGPDLTVSGLGGQLGIDWVIEEVIIDVEHPFTGDLIVYLNAPSGLTIAIALFDGQGANFEQTSFSDSAPISIDLGENPFDGQYQPTVPLSNLNSGPADGVYSIGVCNDGSDEGELLGYSIRFRSLAPAPANDLCNGASPLISGVPQTGTNLSATNNAGVIGCSSGAGLWYTFEGNNDYVTLRVTPADVNIEVGVATGTCGELQRFFCIDNFGVDQAEQASFISSLGQTYYVYVADWAPANYEIGSWTIEFDRAENIAHTPGCSATSSPTFSGNGGWINIGDGLGRGIIASVQDNADLGILEITGHTHGGGSPRTDATLGAYADRSVTITPRTAPSGPFTPVKVRLYLTQAELDDIASANPLVSNIGDLQIYHTPTQSCSGTYPGTGTPEPTSWRVYGDGYFVEASVTSFSSFYVMAGTSAPLPVVLSSLSAKLTGRDVTIEWTTASEEGAAGFEVQHRLGEEPEITLGYVAATGTSEHTQGYRYTHSDVAPGQHYYRLRMIDLDGAETMSPWVAVMLESGVSWQATVSAERQVVVFGAEPDEIVAVVSVMGQIIYRGGISGLTHVQLSSGFYLVTIDGDTRKLVVP